MSDFEKWFRSLNANGKTVYFLGNEHKVSEMAWNHQQAKIEKLENELSTTKQVLGNVIDMEVAKVDDLKTQLNNMETCYIEKKKECEDQQSKIDELQKKRDSFIKAYEIEVDKSVELQKRVDAAQKLFDNWDCGDMNLFDLLHVLQQTLKGGDE